MSITQWINPDIAALTPYEPGRPIEEVARELGLDPTTICKLASNENPLGVSPLAVRAMRRKLPELFRYPEGYAYNLRQKLAAHYLVQPNQLILGAGSNELIEFIGHAFLGKGRSLVVSAYAFVVYKLIAQMFGSRVIEVPADRKLGHRLEAMAEAIMPDTRVIIICNPNNPTGTMVRQTEIKRFVRRIPEDVLVVFDEAYAELCLGRMPDTLEILRKHENCLMLRSFSKAYGLAGLRIGYGIGSAPVISALERVRQPFNTNRLAQEAGCAALDDKGFIRRSRHCIRQGRTYLEEMCRKLDLKFVRSYANFMLIKVGDGAKVTAELTRRGVIVRPMAPYRLPEYIRISFGTPQENEKLALALAETIR